jgi:hypothetical protein
VNSDRTLPSSLQKLIASSCISITQV